MARRKMFVYEVIEKESANLVKRMNHMPLKGRQTPPAIVKRVKDEVGEMAFDIARTCNVLVNYPFLTIQGNEVALGEPVIMLPNCKLVNIQQLRKIERGR